MRAGEGPCHGQRLAEFREGLLPARKAAGIAAHLRECPSCAEADAQLAAVTAILASTPAPPMPASLAERLDAALAVEIARSAGAASSTGAASPAGATPADGAASPAGTASPAGDAPPARSPVPGEGTGHREGTAAGRDRAGRRAPWRLPLRLATAAAAVVILAGGGYAIARVLSPGTTGESASTASGSASRSALSGPAASALPHEAAPAAPGAAVTGGLPLIASGTHYRARQLPAQVGAVLKRYPSPPRPPGAAGSARSFPQLAACVSHLAGGQRPQLVDIASYGSQAGGGRRGARPRHGDGARVGGRAGLFRAGRRCHRPLLHARARLSGTVSPRSSRATAGPCGRESSGPRIG